MAAKNVPHFRTAPKAGKASLQALIRSGEARVFNAAQIPALRRA